jgi:hypothetical protein
VDSVGERVSELRLKVLVSLASWGFKPLQGLLLLPRLLL